MLNALQRLIPIILSITLLLPACQGNSAQKRGPYDPFKSLSPDGQFEKTTWYRPSNQGVKVVHRESGTIVCSDIISPGENWFCPPIQLKDGRWWHVSAGLVLDQPIAEVNSGGLVDMSPNQKWIFGQARRDFQRQPKPEEPSVYYWDEWFIVSADGKTKHSFQLPDVSGESDVPSPCCNMVSWKADSSHFAIHHGMQNFTFIWNVQSDGSVALEQSIKGNHLNRSAWKKGRYAGPWP